MLNDRVANEVRRNGTRSSGTDDDRVFCSVVHKYMLVKKNVNMLVEAKTPLG